MNTQERVFDAVCDLAPKLVKKQQEACLATMKEYSTYLEALAGEFNIPKETVGVLKGRIEGMIEKTLENSYGEPNPESLARIQEGHSAWVKKEFDALVARGRGADEDGV